MRKRAALLACLLGLAQAHAAQITDDRGVAVSLPRPPQRIVSLLPSLTETVCALGACERLVGVDDYSNHPPQVQKLPHTGGLEDANVEMIVSLKPDLVLLATASRIMERLEGLGIKVAALEPRSHAQVKRVLEQTAALLEVKSAPRIWAEIEAGMQAAAQSVPAAVRGSTVYFEVNNAPYAAGESSFIGQTLARLGVRNIVPASLGPFPRLNPEFVVRADPQVIMVSDRNAGSFKDRPGWDRIRAVRDARVCRFTPAQGDALVRAGPRMAEGARLMALCLQGRLGKTPEPSPPRVQ